MKKLAVILLTGLVLVVALVAFLLLHEFDSPRLGQALLNKVGAATGIEMTAKAFRLSLLHGLVLEKVEASSKTADRRLHLTLDRLVFEHRLGPLFSGTVAIHKVLLERPQIEVVEAAEPAPGNGAAENIPAEKKPEPVQPTPAATGGNPSDEDRRLSLELRELAIQDATLTVSREGSTRGARLEGLTLTMSQVALKPTARSLAALSGTGEISLLKGRLDTLALRDARTRFQLENARLDMPELSVTTDYGRLGSEAHLDFNPSRLAYHLKAKGQAIDLNKILNAPGGLGPGSLELNASGVGVVSKDMKADGRIELAPGKLPAIPALREVDKVLGKKVLVGSSYKPTEARFKAIQDVLTLSPFRFESEHARIDLHGTAAMAGPLDLTASVATPIDGLNIDGVAAGVLTVLGDSAGWVPLPIHISGTLEQPQVRPDTKALLAQAKQGTVREAKEAGQRAKERTKEKATSAIKRALPRRPR